MALLIAIKNVTTIINSPNTAYYCGNTMPWYYSAVISNVPKEWLATPPYTCTQKPYTCSASNYYQQSEFIDLEEYGVDYNFTAFSQYGYVQSSTSSGAADNPFYGFTVGDTSSVFYNYYFPLDNPSLDICSILYSVYYRDYWYQQNGFIAVLPEYPDGTMTEVSNAFISYLLNNRCRNSYIPTGALQTFSSQDELDDYVTDKHYNDAGYGKGKVAFAIVWNKVDTTAAQFEYSIRANFTSLVNQNEDTTACLYSGCKFTYTIPSTKFYTYDLLKPQSADYMYGYSFSGFSTLQEELDRFIFSLYTNVMDVEVTVGMMPTSAYETDNFQFVISSTLGIFYMLSFIYPVSRIVRALVLEKELRIKEGMKMMGLTDTVYNLHWFIVTFVQMTLVSILITLVTGGSVFEYSNKVYVFFYFEIFSLTIMMMCFLLATLFSRSKTAALLGPFIFFASFFPYYAVNDPQFSPSAKSATCILAPACFALGAEVFAQYEGGMVGLQSSNVNQEVNNFTYTACVGMMLFDVFLYGFLAWYLDKVIPSEYGTPLPFYFPFMPSYWLPDSTKPRHKRRTWQQWLCTGFGLFDTSPDYQQVREQYQETLVASGGGGGGGRHGEETILQLLARQQQENKFFEELSPEMIQQLREERCVVTKKLRRVFKNAAGGEDKVAVKELTLPLFEGHVNVLLGHNGAGKTTTISMLVGLIPASGGDALMPGGYSILQDMQHIRSILGVCPQHDILFPDLTAMQHLQIFAAFKGVPNGKIHDEAVRMLSEVGLSEKAHTKSAALSGGQKRKLSLGIALIGDSKVVVLDEPTSGMDPYSRRATWNIIQRNKRGRIILLTTHFMDEADILGDRVSIMADGVLQCSGSPLYLKKCYGVGYTLTIARPVGHSAEEEKQVSEALPPSERVEQLVLQQIPQAQVLSKVGAEQSYRLPLSASAEFVDLFRQLDQLRNDDVINEYGISVTTMEEVFMKVADAGHYDQQHQAAAPATVPSVDRGSATTITPFATSLGGNAAAALEDESLHSPGLMRSIDGNDPASRRLLAPKTDAKDIEKHAADHDDVEDFEDYERFVRHKADIKKRLGSWSLFFRHVVALVYKRAIYAKRDRRLLVCQLLLPVFLVILGLCLLLIVAPGEQPDLVLSPVKFNTDFAAATRNYVPILKETGCGAVCAAIEERFKDGSTDDGVYGIGLNVNEISAATPASLNDAFAGCAQGADVLHQMSNFLLQVPADAQSTIDGRSVYGAVTLGAGTTANLLQYNVLVNGSAAHGVGIYMNLVNSAFLQVVSKRPHASITAHNYPLPLTYDQIRQSNTISAFVAALFVMIALCFVPASFALFVVREREVKAQHQQFLTGVSGAAYWFSTWLWDSFSYLVTGVAILGLFYGFNVAAYTENDARYATIALMLLFGPAAAAHTYILSFAFNSHSTAQVVVMFYNFLTGLCLMVVSFVLTTIPDTSSDAYTLRYIFRFFPAYCVGDGILQMALCTNGQECPHINRRGYVMSGSTQSPLAWDITGGSIAFLIAQVFIAFPITLLIEYLKQRDLIQMDVFRARLSQQLYAFCGCCFSSPPAAATAFLASQTVDASGSHRAVGDVEDDADVAIERQRIHRTQSNVEEVKKDVVRVVELRKVYYTGSSMPTPDGVGIKVAVRGLSFGVPRGECFGFLGINGAGKTTTMSILTGDLPASSGAAFIAGEEVTKDQSKGLRKQGKIGYCPQFDALLDLLTTREHLEMFGRIQGLTGADLQEAVERKLREMDLLDHAGKISSSLSGGNRRKLSVAVATMHDPAVLFLDEPSTGMDPVARRFMWRGTCFSFHLIVVSVHRTGG
jgi:ATP-binding cassette subfamily A (ABC1) protein 3